MNSNGRRMNASCVPIGGRAANDDDGHVILGRVAGAVPVQVLEHPVPNRPGTLVSQLRNELDQTIQLVETALLIARLDQAIGVEQQDVALGELTGFLLTDQVGHNTHCSTSAVQELDAARLAHQ
jgi:hypothetical protein